MKGICCTYTKFKPNSKLRISIVKKKKIKIKKRERNRVITLNQKPCLKQ